MVSSRGMISGVAVVLALGGCQTPAAPAPKIVQDVEFVRGCWVSKDYDGRITMMLRLLPDKAGSDSYAGDVMVRSGDQMLRGGMFSFRRDGSALTLEIGGLPPETLPFKAMPPDALPKPLDRNQITFLGDKPKWDELYVAAEGMNDRLWIGFLSKRGVAQLDFVDMDRDGCD
jgi:hypothetical protein